MPDDGDAMGPVSYLIVQFPGNRMTGEGLAVLVDLVDRGLIRILDLVFVSKDDKGNVSALELTDIDHDGVLDLAVFDGAGSGLLDDSDFADAADVIDANSSAGILVFEHRWAAPFTAALRRSGAELVAAGFIPQDTLLSSIETTD